MSHVKQSQSLCLIWQVTNVGEIPRIASLAWRTASSGTPGPVLVDFPIDVLFTPVEKESIAWGNVTGPLVTLPGPDPAAIGQLATLLQDAERPVVIVGTGARAVSYDCLTICW